MKNFSSLNMLVVSRGGARGGAGAPVPPTYLHAAYGAPLQFLTMNQEQKEEKEEEEEKERGKEEERKISPSKFKFQIRHWLCWDNKVIGEL